MKAQESNFSFIVETIYSLSIEDRIEIKNLLDHNIAETRRNEIVTNYQAAKDELNNDKLNFSSDISMLKKMI